MGLKVNTNVNALQILNIMDTTNSAVAKSLQRLSSGLRINSAKDDASGFAIANSFAAKISSMQVASQNANEAQSMLQTADGAYSKINDIMVRMKALATQAASGQTENLDTMNNEFKNLQDEIDRISQSTKYGSVTLCDGTGSGVTGITFQVGCTNSAINQDDGHLLWGYRQLSGSEQRGPVSIDSLASAQAAMDALDTALTSINAFMGNIGAYQNRLQYTIENLSVSIENYSSSESTIRDVDMASEVSTFTKNQILQQSAMAMLAQANSAPQQILSLLRG